jgi:hypothetical protein
VEQSVILIYYRLAAKFVNLNLWIFLIMIPVILVGIAIGLLDGYNKVYSN